MRPAEETLLTVTPVINFIVQLLQYCSDTEVSAGVSKHPFKIEISRQLPSTFSNCHGSIKYYLKAVVKRHLRIDITVKIPLNLVALTDLNTFLAALQIRADYSTDRIVSNLCGLSRGRIILNADISKRLFVIGETIVLDINIINLSGVKVKKVYCRIMNTVTSYFTHPYAVEEIYRDFVAKSRNFPGIDGYGETSYPLYIDVPSNLFVPNLKYSKLFKITYQLQVIAKLSGCNTAMILQFKIYLGHIPLAGFPIDEYKSRKGPYIRGADTPSSSSVKRAHY